MRQDNSSIRKYEPVTLPTEVTHIQDGSHKHLTVSTKMQNFFIADDETNSGVRGLPTADKTPTSQQISDLRASPILNSRLLQRRNDRYDTPDEIAIRDETNDDISPMPKKHEKSQVYLLRQV